MTQRRSKEESDRRQYVNFSPGSINLARGSERGARMAAPKDPAQPCQLTLGELALG